ncbi:hypothetical protein [Bradyrhizobium sp. CCBAU 45384]|uniref:hypothetical protein n=1 Tax=Bradyrhizobium sp. CCBAU 45384 TaxID=858428 RepID=UPI002306CFDB|nr:hypothetical protein [Bradyrhizobium sp. CCBAU 45384]
MTRPSPFSIRGRRALMVMRDEREISIVRRQLSRLGMTISEHDPAEPPPIQPSDVILLNADSIPIKSDHATLWKGSVRVRRSSRLEECRTGTRERHSKCRREIHRLGNVGCRLAERLDIQ